MGLEPRDYRKKPLKVFIAIGHGGLNPGAMYGGRVEKHINRNIAMLMQGNHFVQERLFSDSLGKGVHYDSKTKKQTVYPKKFFAVSEVSGELLRATAE